MKKNQNLLNQLPNSIILPLIERSLLTFDDIELYLKANSENFIHYLDELEKFPIILKWIEDKILSPKTLLESFNDSIRLIILIKTLENSPKLIENIKKNEMSLDILFDNEEDELDFSENYKFNLGLINFKFYKFSKKIDFFCNALELLGFNKYDDSDHDIFCFALGKLYKFQYEIKNDKKDLFSAIRQFLAIFPSNETLVIKGFNELNDLFKNNNSDASIILNLLNLAEGNRIQYKNIELLPFDSEISCFLKNNKTFLSFIIRCHKFDEFKFLFEELREYRESYSTAGTFLNDWETLRLIETKKISFSIFTIVTQYLKAFSRVQKSSFFIHFFEFFNQNPMVLKVLDPRIIPPDALAECWQSDSRQEIDSLLIFLQNDHYGLDLIKWGFEFEIMAKILVKHPAKPILLSLDFLINIGVENNIFSPTSFPECFKDYYFPTAKEIKNELGEKEGDDLIQQAIKNMLTNIKRKSANTLLNRAIKDGDIVEVKALVKEGYIQDSPQIISPSFKIQRLFDIRCISNNEIRCYLSNVNKKIDALNQAFKNDILLLSNQNKRHRSGLNKKQINKSYYDALKKAYDDDSEVEEVLAVFFNRINNPNLISRIFSFFSIDLRRSITTNNSSGFVQNQLTKNNI